MKNLLGLVALTALMAGPAYANCVFPPPPEKIPDGRTATREEMIAAQKVVKDYETSVTAYNACLELEKNEAIAKGGEQMTAEQKAKLTDMHDKKHDAAIDQLESVAKRYNDQVKIYNARDDKGTEKKKS
jgi:hypothetical protein